MILGLNQERRVASDFSDKPLLLLGTRMYDLLSLLPLVSTRKPRQQGPRRQYPETTTTKKKIKNTKKFSSSLKMETEFLVIHLDIIIEHEMSCSVLGKKIEGIMVCKVFKLVKTVEILA